MLLENFKKERGMTKTALITGITGQDGSYLAELLLEKGYEVHGIVRRSSSFNTERIDHLYQDPHKNDQRLFLHFGDLADASTMNKLIHTVGPDEIYNLGAQSHVRVSFDIPEYTANIVALGTLRILEAIRDYQQETGRMVKLYQASSSEMFGASPPPQNEQTKFHPCSPYAVAKVFAYHMVVNYREAYNIFAVNGILFNHESERRGKTFVTRKITKGLARIKLGKEEKLYLGNLNAKRDWGHAKDFVCGMWLMLQQEKPDDYVLATGESHSVREFAEKAANSLKFDLIWKGEGLSEKAIDRNTGKVIIEIDPKYFRPTEINLLLGDYSKAKRILGWQPQIKFEKIAKMMAEFDYKIK